MGLYSCVASAEDEFTKVVREMEIIMKAFHLRTPSSPPPPSPTHPLAGLLILFHHPPLGDSADGAQATRRQPPEYDRLPQAHHIASHGNTWTGQGLGQDRGWDRTGAGTGQGLGQDRGWDRTGAGTGTSPKAEKPDARPGKIAYEEES